MLFLPVSLMHFTFIHDGGNDDRLHQCGGDHGDDDPSENDDDDCRGEL